MAYTRRFNRDSSKERTSRCSCGGEAKITSKRNFPFGRNSDSVTSWFHKCSSCNKITFINKDEGGKR